MNKYTVCAMTGSGLEGVPSEIKLIPLGTIKSQKGTFQADEESFRLIKERFENRKLDLVIDYEHQTLKDVQAPASGWIKELRLGEDAIIAKVDWTDRAKEYLKNKEYRYLSPVIISRNSDKKVIGVHSAALTNTPAIDGMFAIANSLDIEDLEQGGTEMELQKILELLGLSPETSEEEALAAIGKLQEAAKAAEKAAEKKEEPKPGTEGGEELVANSTILSLLGLKETARTEDVAAAITGLKAAPDVVKELTALKEKLEQKEASEAVSEAMKAGKLAAAQKDWAMDYALKDLSGFQAFVSKAPVVVPMGKLELQDAKDTGTLLDDAALTACKLLGVSKEDVEKYGKVE